MEDTKRASNKTTLLTALCSFQTKPHRLLSSRGIAGKLPPPTSLMEIKSLLWNPNRNIVIRKKKKKELKRKPSSMASNHHYHNR